MFGDAACLLFTDTHSLTFLISVGDADRDIEPLINDYFDTFDHPKDQFLYSCTNAKVPGKMTVEICEKSPLGFVV
jgi:hypothetical protein